MLKKLMKAYLLFVVYFSLILFMFGCICYGTNSSADTLKSYQECVAFFLALYIVFPIIVGFLYLLEKIGFLDKGFWDD